MEHISFEYPCWGEIFYGTPYVVKIIMPLLSDGAGGLNLTTESVERSIEHTKALIEDAKANNMPFSHYLEHIQGLTKWNYMMSAPIETVINYLPGTEQPINKQLH